jgi:hypothetical protein
MNKFIKVLIVINGVLIPLILVIVLFVFVLDLVFPMRYNHSAGVRINNEVLNKNGDTVVCQGVEYSSPLPVYNSSNFYMTVRPKSQDESRSRSSYMKKANWNGDGESYVNILFLDGKYNCIGKLVDRKASIEKLNIPACNDVKEDTSVRNIACLIAYSDTNKDGVLNWQDDHDLYVASLSSTNLTRVTSNMDIVGFEFVNSHEALFITFNDRLKEHQHNKFAIYDIKSKQLRVLTTIDKSMRAVESILNGK